MTLSQFAVTPFDNTYQYATKAVDSFAKTDIHGRTKQDIDDAKPSDYIDHVGIITDRDEDTLQPFVAHKLHEYFGYPVDVVVDVIDSEIRGTEVTVHPRDSDGHCLSEKQHNAKLAEVKLYVEQIIGVTA